MPAPSPGKAAKYIEGTRARAMKTDQKNTRRYLAGGYIVPKKSGEVDRERAAGRWKFIKVVKRRVRICFERLRDDVFPVFDLIETRGERALPEQAALSTLATQIYSAAEEWIRDNRLETWVDAESLRRELEMRLKQNVLTEASRNTDLASALSIWAQEFNLDEEWIREGALVTLRRWHDFPNLQKQLDVTGFYTPVADTLEIPRGVDVFHFGFEGFVYPAWDIRTETSAEWLSRLRKLCNKELTAQAAAHIRTMRQVARDQGLRKAQRYSPVHFDWFALFQCRNLTLEEIGRRYNKEPRTVSKGVHRVAKLVGIAVRTRRTADNRG
jgi:hypothetical protein